MSEQPERGDGGMRPGLAAWFVATAGINFAGGAALGGWMAANPSVWPYIGAVHGSCTRC
ncbi:hypothetical protein GCM10025857_29780 [Alicyclobacillus contaminans]|uniref:hypothetical protein n=1 Tax=Alicyclobacillus contaminans TaxID=392016 RepID=UPI000416F3A9|nr:hypothetical protein [Alicyclobacillus contaminans]GMA51621.1 hypothetical protein GCM10025857_29780 [Alicyclobacillus contaminans]